MKLKQLPCVRARGFHVEVDLVLHPVYVGSLGKYIAVSCQTVPFRAESDSVGALLKDGDSAVKNKQELYPNPRMVNLVNFDNGPSENARLLHRNIDILSHLISLGGLGKYLADWSRAVHCLTCD